MFSFGSSSVKRGKEIMTKLFYFAEQAMLDCNQYVVSDPETNELAIFDAGNGLSLKGLFEGMKTF